MYWFLKSDKDEDGLSQFIEFDNCMWCDIDFLPTYVEKRLKGDLEQRLLAETIENYVSALMNNDEVDAIYVRLYIKSLIGQIFFYNNNVEILIKHKPFIVEENKRFKNPSSYFINMQIHLDGGYKGWFSRMLNSKWGSDFGWGWGSGLSGETERLKYLRENTPDISAVKSTETILGVYLKYAEQTEIEKYSFTYSSVLTIRYVYRTLLNFLLEGRLFDDDGFPLHYSIQESYEEAKKNGTFTLENVFDKIKAKGIILNNWTPGSGDKPTIEKTTIDLPVEKIIDKKKVDTAEPLAHLVLRPKKDNKSTKGNTKASMWEYMVNFGFRISDFAKAINRNPQNLSSIKPTASPNNLKLLQKYQLKGTLSKADIKAIEEPPDKDKK